MNSDSDCGGFEPVAIVGMGCRFAGDSCSPSKLWDMLKDGRSGQSDVPKNRFNIDSWHSPAKGRPGSLYSKGGYFLSHDDSYRNFDPSFFAISPLEATSMDPQQRKLLEVVFECFESAGKILEEISGSETACYVGCFSTDFDHIQSKDPEYSLPYQSTGSGMTILSNRISYVYNLRGPSLTVDTACSSSLYALHLGCQALLAGDCTAAVVGGSSLIASVEKHLGSERLGILSPTSACHTFDASADGFGRGDGVAALYIKRLSDAVANGDPIRAVIRSTAINANGRGLGINHPSQEAQEAVIRKAYARAGLDFAQTGYFECHGTGTPVGDPIECAAIGNVFTESRTINNPLLIGSVKTNIGHCEGASGLAAVIKTVLCLENGQIPATIGVEELNPNIDFKSGRLSVVRSLTPWPQKANNRRASVNSFGYGGANAHVILDAADSFLRKSGSSLDQKEASTGSGKRRHLLVFSAHDQATLKNNIRALSKVATKYTIPDISYTLGAHRTKFMHRGFSICSSSTISEQLQESKVTYGLSRHTDFQIAFAFTGQGAQWPQMCYALICYFPLVRQTFERLEQSLQKLPTPPDFSIIEVLSAPKESTTVYHSVWSPVCCTAVQVALTILLQSWGIRPTAVVGHSAGEISAAFAAGLITETEAVAIAYYRGIAVLNCKENGSMLAVGLGPEEVQPFIRGQSDVVIGCYNSPQSVTLSGRAHAIEEIRVSLTQAGIFARKVNTSDNAYHSHLMASAAQEFQTLFEGIYSEMAHSLTRKETLPRIPMYSCITGKLLEFEIMPFEYWRSSLELPVLFDQASQVLLASHSTVSYIVEIGPHSALAGPIRQITMSLGFSEERLTYLPTLVRGEDGVDNVLRLVGTLFNVGYPIDLTLVNSMDTYYSDVDDEINCQNGRLLVDLPTYQWNYEGLLWKESRWGRELRFRKHCRHDLLGSREPGGSQNSHLWRNHLDVSFVPWLQDHKIGNDILFPAAGYIAMAIEALKQLAHDQDLLVPLQGYTIQGLNINSALIIPTEGSVETLFNMRDLSLPGQGVPKCFDFRISSVSEDGRWCEHGAGMIYLAEPYGDIEERNSVGRRTKVSSSKNWYAALSSAGITFGPSFQTVSDISFVPERNEAIADLALLTTKDVMAAESQYIIHPTSIDGCLQMSVLAAYCNTKLISKAFIPICIEDLTVWTPPISERMRENAIVNAQGNLQGLRSVHGTARVFCEDGHLLVQGRVRFLSLEGGLIHSHTAIPRQPYSRLVWKPDVDRLSALCYPLDPDRDAISFVSAHENFDLLDFIDLLGHKSRSLKILQFGIGSSGPLVKDLGGDSRSIYSQYTIASHDDTSIEEAKKFFSGSSNMDFRVLNIEQARSEKRIGADGYDLVILSETHGACGITSQALTNCLDLLKPNGKLWIDAKICEAQTTLLTDLTTAGFTGGLVRISQSQNVIVAESRRVLSDSSRTHKTLWLVYHKNPHPLCENISRVAAKFGILTTSVSLLHVQEVIPTDSKIIMMAELESLCLSRMNMEELTALQYLVKKASSFIWVTNGGRLDGSQPEKSLASGLAKTLMNEQPSLCMTCFDIEPQETNLVKSAVFIIDQHIRLQTEERSEVEMDLVQKNGLIYISRFLPDNPQNDLFERRMNPPVVNGLFGAHSPMELDFQLVGQIDSFYYKQKRDDGTSLTLQPNEILLEPQAYSLSVMEATILRGQQESEFFSHESASTVRACGSDIVNFRPGDRVLSLKPGKFDSSFVVRENNCHKLLPNENIEDLVGEFVPACTALHVLNNLSREERRGAILVHVPGDHLLASAFIQLARDRGLQLFTTYNSEAERCYFLNVEGVPGDHLISANAPAWTRSLKISTAAQDISAIIASATAHDHQELWKTLGENGTYRLLGSGRHIPKLATFDNSIFSRGSSIVSFDILNILQKGNEDLNELIRETFKLYRCGKLAPRSPISFFDISQLQDAVSFTYGIDKAHRIILRCSPNLNVPCRDTYKPSSFDPSATFLMIGCLGGLGRSITTWMVERGARHFVFLSRSGAEGPEAAALLNEFDEYSRTHGLDIIFHVVRGDVSTRSDVEKAIAIAETPIKGVIHAAATFQKCLFENMTVEKFHEVLDPKVRGTINLHEALFSVPLDFFVMTSSTLGIRGPVTQSGYAAANAFMDSMARHRWSLGMQATSLALGMVQEIGHVEAHPEIKAAMLHNNLYGINETEFLAMMELACQPHHLSSSPLPLSKYDMYSNALIVTGMELTINPTLQRTWLQDKRLQHLGREKPALAAASTSQNSNTLDILLNAFNSNGEIGVKNAVKEIVLKRISKLFLMPVEKLKESMSKPLAGFGLDSMVSSEVRALAWSEFKADVPLMKILESGLLFQELLDLIWQNMDSGLKSGNIPA